MNNNRLLLLTSQTWFVLRATLTTTTCVRAAIIVRSLSLSLSLSFSFYLSRCCLLLPYLHLLLFDSPYSSSLVVQSRLFALKLLKTCFITSTSLPLQLPPPSPPSDISRIEENSASLQVFLFASLSLSLSLSFSLLDWQGLFDMPTSAYASGTRRAIPLLEPHCSLSYVLPIISR